MSGRCGHRAAAFDVLRVLPDGRAMVTRECVSCGSVLSLGHSDETPERVAVEIRAVEVVNARAAQRPDLVTTDEFYGWTLHECDSTSGDLRADVEAGWLARCLWTHCDDHPDKDETP